ncbi:hypothetical protein ABK040_000949 [Willaertia magna]
MVQRQTKYGIATNNTLKKNAYINQQLKASGDIFIYLKNDDNYNNETVTVRNYSLDKQKRWELVEELQKQQEEEEEEQQDNNKPQLLTKKERKEKNQVNKKLNFEKSLTKSKYQNKLITEEEKKKKLAQQQLEQLEEEENNNYDEKYYEEEQQPKIKVLNAEKNYRQNPMIFRIDKDEKEDGQIEVFERPTRSELFKMNQQNKSRYDHKPVENRKSKKENFTNSLNL